MLRELVGLDVARVGQNPQCSRDDSRMNSEYTEVIACEWLFVAGCAASESRITPRSCIGGIGGPPANPLNVIREGVMSTKSGCSRNVMFLLLLLPRARQSFDHFGE